MEKLQEPRNESDCRKKAKSKKEEAKQRGKHCLVICSTHCQTMANLLNTQKEDYTVVENHPKSLIFS